MMEIKKYSEPTMEITEFDVYDIITESPGPSTPNEADQTPGFIDGWY